MNCEKPIEKNSWIRINKLVFIKSNEKGDGGGIENTPDFLYWHAMARITFLGKGDSVNRVAPNQPTTKGRG
jgi:hypothetical protein